MENVVGGAEAEENRLMDVLKKSHIASFRKGMSPAEILNLTAQELSGGEQKRVCYARALYKICEVLVLDEYTASLHAEMARQLEREMLVSGGPLVIHVTHMLQPENAALYDGVFQIQDGTVQRVS